jgi:hypothetical protein
MKFRATIQLNGKTATGIQVPAKVVTALGPSKRPAVRATVAGYTYRSTVASMGGGFMLPVSADVRERAGVAAGDTVVVELELDTKPREVNVPRDFAAALRRDAKAHQLFENLSYSNKQRFVLSIEGAKTAATRERRIDNAVTTLREGRT